MQDLYSYKLKTVVTMVDDQDFAVIETALLDIISSLRGYKQETGEYVGQALIDSAEAKKERLHALYEGMTGNRLNHYYDMFYVKRSNYGPVCPTCAKPFRTPRASFCAECGYDPAHI